MHEVEDKNEEKRESSSNSKRARSLLLLKTRTGPTALLEHGSNSSSLQQQQQQQQKEQEQQKRIAARAANAMAQVLQRRREPRSLLMWGDRKKAIIKNYPDGGQEIIVPQTLTPEQEHYEFPPRSRFLKKLATSTAERTRLSLQFEQQPQQQDQVVFSCYSPPTAPADLSFTAIVPTRTQQSYQHEPSTTQNTTTEEMMKQPDQLALQEWFSKKQVLTSQHLENRNSKTTLNKDRAVIDWMNDVERSSKNLLSLKKQQIKPSPTPSSCNNSNKIQFKSDAGKRWASSITSNASLVPPADDDASTKRKHYVPRKLLTLSSRNKRMKPMSSLTKEEQEVDRVQLAAQAASKIQKIWKDYQQQQTINNGVVNNRLIENQIGMAAMTTTGQRTPIAGMVHLVQMLSDSLKVQQQRSHDRMQQLELLLKEETKKRKLAEEKTSYEKEEAYQSLLIKVSELEQSVKHNNSTSRSRKESILEATNSAARRRRRSRTSSFTKTPTLSTRQSSVVMNETPPSSSSSSTRKRLQPFISSRKESIMTASPNAKRSLARTSSLANAGVVTSPSSPKRASIVTKTPTTRTTTTTTTNRRMTVVPSSQRH